MEDKAAHLYAHKIVFELAFFGISTVLYNFLCVLFVICKEVGFVSGCLIWASFLEYYNMMVFIIYPNRAAFPICNA
jgi:hypothetical protein